jgi:hypothetical protein
MGSFKRSGGRETCSGLRRVERYACGAVIGAVFVAAGPVGCCGDWAGGYSDGAAPVERGSPRSLEPWRVDYCGTPETLLLGLSTR